LSLDPLNRLDHFQTLKEKLEKEVSKANDERIEANTGFGADGYATVMTRRRKKEPTTIPTLYEWDIHPGDVSKKLLPTLPLKDKLSSGTTSTIGVTGNFSLSRDSLLQNQKNQQHLHNHDFGNFGSEEAVYADRVYQPKVTLLINNYVKSKVLPSKRIIDPNNIHRVSSRQEDKKNVEGDYQSILNSVQATISIPEYGMYDLKRNQPLPKIFQSLLSSCEQDHI
jgi:hypothetical protein